MNTSIEQVLQMVGELTVKVRLLEEENARLKQLLEELRQPRVTVDERATGSDD